MADIQVDSVCVCKNMNLNKHIENKFNKNKFSNVRTDITEENDFKIHSMQLFKTTFSFCWLFCWLCLRVCSSYYLLHICHAKKIFYAHLGCANAWMNFLTSSALRLFIFFFFFFSLVNVLLHSSYYRIMRHMKRRNKVSYNHSRWWDLIDSF